jgi:N-acyl amino acid synthase of PEP-CTERM/exosortase system
VDRDAIRLSIGRRPGPRGRDEGNPQGSDMPPPAPLPQYFSFTPVREADPVLTSVRRLRFEVYCRECGFLDEANYPDGTESDEFDPYAVQFAAFDARHEVVATVRLIVDSFHGFPLERHAGPALAGFQRIPRDRAAEISRLILAKSYRRRRRDGLYGLDLGTGPADHRSPYPLILFGLLREMYRESLRLRLEYWVAALDDRLRDLLGRFGFAFGPIGEPIEYYGTVVPCAIRLADLAADLARERPEVGRFFTEPGPGRRDH